MHEATTHLSRLLARVDAGERIAITNRGRTVAVLGPPPADGAPRSGVDAGRFVVPEDVDAPLTRYPVDCLLVGD